jgi:hypothetical protein
VSLGQPCGPDAHFRPNNIMSFSHLNNVGDKHANFLELGGFLLNNLMLTWEPQIRIPKYNEAVRIPLPAP